MAAQLISLLHPVILPWYFTVAAVTIGGAAAFPLHPIGQAMAVSIALYLLANLGVVRRAVRERTITKLAAIPRLYVIAVSLMICPFSPQTIGQSDLTGIISISISIIIFRLAFAPVTLYYGLRLFVSTRVTGHKLDASLDAPSLLTYTWFAFLTLTTVVWLDVCDLVAYQWFDQRGRHGDADADHSKCPYFSCTLRHPGPNPLAAFLGILLGAMQQLPRWMFLWLSLLSGSFVSALFLLPHPLALAASLSFLSMMYLTLPLALAYGGIVKLMGVTHLLAIPPVVVYAVVFLANGGLDGAVHLWAWCFVIINSVGLLFDLNDAMAWFLLGHRAVLKPGIDVSKLPKQLFGYTFKTPDQQ